MHSINFMSDNSKTTGVTGEAGTANPSGAHEFTPCFSGVRVGLSLVFCVVFHSSLFYFIGRRFESLKKDIDLKIGRRFRI